MASKEAEGKAVLASFTKIHEALDKAKEEIQKILRETAKEQYEKKVTFIGLLSQYKILGASLDEMHHSIGHALFDDCWIDVAVGDEGNGGYLKQILDSLSMLLKGHVEVETLDLDGPLPDDIPQVVKDKIEEIRNARAMAAKSHLH